jgi:guanidinopropionase
MNQPNPMPIDSLSVPRFAEIATFMRAPKAGLDQLEAIDVALCGVPFDLGVGFRPGARFGPAALREASRLIRRINATTKVNPFELARVGDTGDAPSHPFDLLASFDLITQYFQRLRDAGVRPVAAGGDHSISLPILRGLTQGKPFALIQIDSHADIFDEFLGNRYNHATPFRRAIEEGLLDPKRVVQVGLRGGLSTPHDLDWGREVGIRMIDYDEYESLGRANVIGEIKRVVGNTPAYITFDIDGLDAIYTPGTGVPEPGGISMRDAQMILRSLTGLDVVGADVVEVAPPFDPTGITAINGANIMYELLCVVAAACSAR